MVRWRWAGNVRYYEYTPASVAYESALDAFTVARAELYTANHEYRLSLSVVVTTIELSIERLVSLEEAIVRGREILESLIAEYNSTVPELTANVSRIFGLTGRRLR